MSISIPHAEWWEQLQGEISTNPFYDSVVANTVYKQRDGVWFQNGKVFLNSKSPLFFAFTKLSQVCVALSIGLVCTRQ